MSSIKQYTESEYYDFMYNMINAIIDKYNVIDDIIDKEEYTKKDIDDVLFNGYAVYSMLMPYLLSAPTFAYSIDNEVILQWSFIDDFSNHNFKLAIKITSTGIVRVLWRERYDKNDTCIYTRVITVKSLQTDNVLDSLFGNMLNIFENIRKVAHNYVVC